MRRRAAADPPLERALAALRDALDATGAPWMVIGGVAIIARGVRRMTTDIDACVRGDAITPERLVATLATHEIEPRVPDGLAFARANLVLLARHRPTGVDLDVSLAWTHFEHEALAAASATRYGRVEAPMASAQDLIVFKTIAGRARDRDDVAALLALHGATVDRARIRERVGQLAALAEEPAMLEGLALLDDADARGRAPAPTPRPRPRGRGKPAARTTRKKQRG